MGQANVVRTSAISDDVRPVAQQESTAEPLYRLLEVAAALDPSLRQPGSKTDGRNRQALLQGLIRWNEEDPDGFINKSSPSASGKGTDEQEARPAGWYKLFVKPLHASWGMLDNEKLQLAGPVVVISAVACAELGAHALAYWPSSSLLWYLNLEVFRPLHYEVIVENRVGDFAQTLCVVVPLFALICIGLITKIRLPLALASNMSLLYSLVLLYGLYLANAPYGVTGVKLSALWGPSLLLAGSVLLASFLSSAISHRAYWRELFS